MPTSRVIDADGHVWEPDSLWEHYLPAEYRDRRPRLVTDNRGTSRYMLEGRLIPPGEGPGAWASEGIFEATTHREGGFDAKQRLVDMDTEGIDTAVLFGSFGLALWQATDPGFAAALCRAYNDWLADYCSADPARLKGIPALPYQDLTAAVQEGRRAVRELGMVAINLQTNVRGLRVDHPSLAPVYELASELGVPITFHAGGGQFVEPRFDNYAISHTLAFPFDIMFGIASALCGGVLERYPDLRFVFLEAGCGFFPYFIERLDEHFTKRRGEMPIPRKPSEYVEQGRVLVSCEPDEKSIAWVVESVGADKIMYASDYPHWDCEFPDSVRKIAERPELDEATKSKILGDNAAGFFGL